MVANGPGPELAAQAVDAALEANAMDAVVSTGLCGGLSADLKVGEILIADCVIDEANGMRHTATTPVVDRRFRTGTVISSDRVAVTVSDKRRLAGKGAQAVEMEAAGVARRALERGIAFFCIRSVSDSAEEALVLDFNALRDDQGRFSRPRIIGAALRRPWTAIPALMQINRNSRVAAESMGEFLADCRF